MLFLLKRIFWHLIGIAVVKECCIGPVFTPFDPPTCVIILKRKWLTNTVSNTVSNASSKYKQIVYTHEQARKYIIACSFCNIKGFWAYLAAEHNKDKL